MNIGQAMQSLAELLGSRDGNIALGVSAFLVIAAPFVDRLIVRRKRVQFRVLYNSKIGLSPVDLHDGDNRSAQADPRLVQVARLVNPMSIVVIRIRNIGSFDITPDDFETPISFTFGRRVVWDARVSEPTSEDLRELIRDNMEFFTDADSSTDQVDGGEKLPEVRASLGQRLARLLGSGGTQSAPGEVVTPQWHGVRLTKLSLKKKEKFKLVVVLREPNDTADKITTEVRRTGRIAGGQIKDEKQQRRITWPVVTMTIGVLLIGALIATLISSSRRVVDPSITCASGSLRIVGSTAFSPIVDTIAQEYSRACPDSDISSEQTGSIDGIRSLIALDPQKSNGLAVLSDGAAVEATNDLDRQPVAVIVYSVVVNKSVGIDRLTSAEIKDIYAGKFHYWNELRPDLPNLPIRIVGRGQESGTRLVFEKQVLGGVSEGALSSDTCESRRPGSDAAPTTRCERGSTADVINQVDTTPGAIGYADLPAANQAAAGGGKLTVVELDDRYPDFSSITQGYPFWTIEYLYTKGNPDSGTLLGNFVNYLRSDTARAELQDAGYTPCVNKTGSQLELCRD